MIFLYDFFYLAKHLDMGKEKTKLTHVVRNVIWKDPTGEKKNTHDSRSEGAPIHEKRQKKFVFFMVSTFQIK